MCGEEKEPPEIEGVAWFVGVELEGLLEVDEGVVFVLLEEGLFALVVGVLGAFDGVGGVLELV